MILRIRYLAIILFIISMCTGCFRSEMNTSMPKTEERSKEVDSEELKIKDTSSNISVETQQNFDQQESVEDTLNRNDTDLSDEELDILYGAAKDDSYYPEMLLDAYQSAIEEAINESDFSIVAKYLVKDSEFYREQQEYVADQYTRGAVHTFISWEFEDFEMVAPDYIENKLYVKENFAVKYPVQDEIIEELGYWVYTIIYNEDEEQWQISRREAWINHAER
ncbi:TcaA NTF2-like domain-containing protein [Paenibacillus fonticola]|uniref:TcaA NTF2-like domain-containing protein n=1 Tax=Paenibacillus fonticola TaxID=379896 RepID=UPI0003768688|nr:hypothetical protein [Paenibacillus fonticola]